MDDILKVDAEVVKQKLSVFRTYFIEIIVVTLCFAVVYLFVGLKSMEHDLRIYLTEDRANAIQKLTINTEAIINNSKQLELNSDLIQVFLKKIK